MTEVSVGNAEKSGRSQSKKQGKKKDKKRDSKKKTKSREKEGIANRPEKRISQIKIYGDGI